VGLVLAPAALLNVCGSETKEEEDLEGSGEEGEAGEAGGMGLMDASSSASSLVESCQEETVDGLNEKEWLVFTEQSGLPVSIPALAR